MPKTKLERIFFTAVTAFFMVYGMTIYNTVLANARLPIVPFWMR